MELGQKFRVKVREGSRATRVRSGGSIPCPKNQYGNMCPEKHPKENNVPVFTDSRIPKWTIKQGIFI